MLDLQYRVMAVNDAFCRAFHSSREQMAGKGLYELGNGQWDIPAVHQLLDEVSRRPDGVSDFEIHHESLQLGRRSLRINARRLDHGSEATRMIILAVTDFTAKSL
jgi:chemotaxis protein methyltransferase CheR